MFSRLRLAVSALLLVLGCSTHAQDGLQYITNCDGQVQTTSTIGRSGQGDVSAATFIGPSTVAKYSNMRIEGVNVGLASTINIESITVWARTSLDGENLFEATVTKSGAGLVKGWNYIGGSPSAVISEGFYLGYTIHQKNACYAVSATGESGDGLLLTNIDGIWADRAADKLGTLSIGAYVSADNLTNYDLSLDSIGVPASFGAGCTENVVLHVSNIGSKQVSGYTVACTTDGSHTQTFSVSRTLAPGAWATDTIAYTTPYDDRHTEVSLSVSITTTNEGDDENATNNTLQATYGVTRYDYTKRLFVEEFTSEQCSNCPRVATMMAKALAKPQYQERVVALCHHSGYSTDWLTKAADKSYVWFYNAGYNTYAPAIMLDRTTSSGSTPVLSTGTISTFDGWFDERLEEEAVVGLKVSATYDAASRKILASVRGERKQEFGATPARVTVYLAENGIAAKKQAGAGGDFVHEHVMDDCSSVWGDVIDWTADGEFSYDCTLSTDNIVDAANLYVLAIVHDYDDGNQMNCRVYNVNRTTEIDWNGSDPAAISLTPTDGRQVRSKALFDVQGRRVTTASQGIVIEKTTYDDGRVSISKRVVR